MESKQKELITGKQVAEMFGVHPDTIRDWANDGKLNSVKTLGGHRRYKLSEIQKIVEERNAVVR